MPFLQFFKYLSHFAHFFIIALFVVLSPVYYYVFICYDKILEIRLGKNFKQKVDYFEMSTVDLEKSQFDVYLWMKLVFRRKWEIFLDSVHWWENVMRLGELWIKKCSLIMGKIMCEKLIKIFLCRKFAVIWNFNSIFI